MQIFETLTWVFQLVLGLSALFIAIVLYVRKKITKQKRVPSLAYFKARVIVQEWLDTKHNNGLTMMNHIRFKLSELICKGLENDYDLKKKEDEIKHEIMFFKNNPLITELRLALLFEMTTRILPSNMDPIGLRRASLIQRIINECLDEKQSSQCCQNCCKCFQRFYKGCKMCFKNDKQYVLGNVSATYKCLETIFKKCVGKKLRKFVPICVTICFTIVFYLLDYYTDFKVMGVYGCQYLTFVNPNTSICYFFIGPTQTTYTLPDDWLYLNLNDTLSKEDSLMVLKKTISYNFLFSSVAMLVILLTSLLTLWPSLRSIKSLYKYKLFMLDVESEKQGAIFSPVQAMQRFDVSILESSVEGSLQYLVQGSTYLANAWLITWIEKDMTHSQDPGDNLQFRVLWPSFVMSLLSQSLARYKKRMRTSEECDGLVKKIIYLIASIMHTVFVSLLLVNCTTVLYDVMTTRQLQALYGKNFFYTPTDLIVNYAIFYLGFLLIAFIFTSELRLTTESSYPDLLTTNCAEYTSCIKKQCLVISAICILSAIFSYLNATRMYDDDGGGHNLAKLRAMFTGQNMTQESPITMFEATPHNNRKIFALISLVAMPLCWLGSSLLIHWYLQKNSLEMMFKHEKVERKGETRLAKLWRAYIQFFRSMLDKFTLRDLKPDVTSKGFWLDLNTETDCDPEEVENYVAQFAKKKEGTEVNFDDEVRKANLCVASNSKGEGLEGDGETSGKEISAEEGKEVEHVDAQTEEHIPLIQILAVDDVVAQLAKKKEGTEVTFENEENANAAASKENLGKGTDYKVESLERGNSVEEEKEGEQSEEHVDAQTVILTTDEEQVDELPDDETDEHYWKLKQIQLSFSYWKFK